MTINVVFNRQTGPYRTGEAAGFDDAVAEKLMAQGAARLLTEQPTPDPRQYPGFGTTERRPPPQASAMEMRPHSMEQPADDGATLAPQAPGAAQATAARSGPRNRMGDAARGA